MLLTKLLGIEHTRTPSDTTNGRYNNALLTTTRCSSLCRSLVTDLRCQPNCSVSQCSVLGVTCQHISHAAVICSCAANNNAFREIEIEEIAGEDCCLADRTGVCAAISYAPLSRTDQTPFEECARQSEEKGEVRALVVYAQTGSDLSCLQVLAPRRTLGPRDVMRSSIKRLILKVKASS